MSKKFFLPLILFFVILLSLTFFYLLNKKTSFQSDLIQYAPAETVLYLEYNFQDESLNKFYQTNSTGVSVWNNICQRIKIFNIWSADLQKEIRKVAYIMVPDNNAWQQIWLLEVGNVRRANSFLPSGWASSILDAKTIVLTPSKENLRLIQSGSGSNINNQLLKNISPYFTEGNFLQVYFSPTYLSKSQPFFLKNFLATDKPLYLSFSIIDQKMVFNINAFVQEENSSNVFVADDKNWQPINNPQDLLLAIKFANSQTVFKKVFSNLEIADNYFNGPVAFFLDGTSADFDSQFFLNLNKMSFGLAFKVSSNQNSEEVSSLIKDYLKNLLAFQYPQKKVKKLPDGSQATELVADPEAFAFKTIDNYEFLSYGNSFFGLAFKDNYLILSNNQNLLTRILNSATDNNYSATEFNGQEALLLNSHLLNNDILNLINYISLDIQQKDKELHLKGNLNW